MNEVIINAMVNKLETLETRMNATDQVTQDTTQTLSQVKEQGEQLKQIAIITKELQKKNGITCFSRAGNASIKKRTGY